MIGAGIPGVAWKLVPTLCLLIAAAGVSLPASAQTAGPQPAPAQATPSQPVWHKQQAPNGEFTVEMPGTPKYKRVDGKSQSGAAYSYHQYTLDHEGRAFVAQTGTYPADVDVRDPKRNLTVVLEASGARLMSKKWDSITWTKLQGATAGEAIGLMNEKLQFRNIVLLKGSQMSTFGFAGPPGTVRGLDAERFFKSLRLGQPGRGKK
jgi:hypothetical protein